MFKLNLCVDLSVELRDPKLYIVNECDDDYDDCFMMRL